jgi:hypothetical protein
MNIDLGLCLHEYDTHVFILQHLNTDIVKKHEADRSKCEFIADREVHPLFRATNEDFR